MKLSQSLLFLMVLCCCSVWFIVIGLDTFASNTSTRLVYAKALPSEEIQFTTITQAGTFTFTVPDTVCYQISPNGKFVTVSSLETVSSIKIYNLLTGLLEFEIPRTTGTPCGVWWKDNQHLIVLDSFIDDEGQYYLIDLNTGSWMGPSIDFLLPPDFPDGFETPIFAPSPDGQNVLMRKCVTGYRNDYFGEGCYGEQYLVIYSIPEQQIIFTFENVRKSFKESYFLRNWSSWSPSGRYLAHRARSAPYPEQLEIFDTTTMQYLNLTIFSSTTDVIDTSLFEGVVWSPDETKISFWVDIWEGAVPNSVDKLAIYDLASNSLQVFPTQYNRSGPSAWSPDNQSVLVTLANGDLIAVGLDGTETLLDQDVISPITSWVNLPPTADAGGDQVTDYTTVTLDGSATFDPDSLMVNYSWSENNIEIATGVSPQVQLGIGTHIITLTVTDDDGAKATDTVTITILAPNATSSATPTDMTFMPEKMQFTQADGCIGDDSYEFCIPNDDPDALAQVQALESEIHCVAWGGRARCDTDTQLLCFVPHNDTRCERPLAGGRYHAMTDAGWALACELSVLPFTENFTLTFFE